MDKNMDKNIKNNTKTKDDIREEQFIGFFETILNNYKEAIIFVVIIILILLLMWYANSKLDFEESKMILNWFGIIVVINVILTYTILIISNQIKNQKGISGAKGYSGLMGKSGGNSYCSVCDKEVEQVGFIEKEKPIKMPLLPAEIIIPSRKKNSKSKTKSNNNTKSNNKARTQNK
jgi:hypothetical protein